MVDTFAAPFVDPGAFVQAWREHGYAVLEPVAAASVCGVTVEALQALASSWNDLRPDTYLRDGGNYRLRRHSCFVIDASHVEQVPPRAHWQSEDYNALHGGMQRWFEPIDPEIVSGPAWQRLLTALAGHCTQLRAAQRWYVEAHQFRIDTTDGIGRPTPEGAHRDGVDFVAVFVVARHAIKGGETRVFEAAGPNGQRFTLAAPWSLLLLDDTRVIHESTPIQPIDADTPGHRDTLVLTFRAGAFQGDGEDARD